MKRERKGKIADFKDENAKKKKPFFFVTVFFFSCFQMLNAMLSLGIILALHVPRWTFQFGY